MSATRGAGWPTLLLIVGAGIVSAFQVGKAPMALAAVRAELGLDLATASWLLSAFALVGAAGGLAIGFGVDRFGARRLALGGLLLQALCSLLGALAGSAVPLLATRVVEGFGFLTVVVAAPTLIVAAAGAARQGRAMALWGTFMPLGMGLVMLGAPLLTLLGWRGFWLANAALLLAYAGLLAWGTRRLAPGRPVPTSPEPRRFGADLRLTLASAAPWLLALLMTAFGTAYFAVFGFLPLILSERLGVTGESATLLAAAAIAVNALGNLACGPLLARGVPRARLLWLGFATMAVAAFGILGAGLPGAAAYALCLLFSAVSGLIPVTLLDAAPRLAPRPDLAGAALGFVMQGSNLGLLLGPALAGALAAASGWSAVPPLVLGVALLAGLLALLLQGRGEGTSA